MMDAEGKQDHPVVRLFREWNPAAVADVMEFRGELTLTIPREHIRQAAELLCASPEFRFTFLSDVTGVDRFPVEPRFELNYHLASIEQRRAVRLKVHVPSSDPVVETVSAVWPTANWHEREVFDLLGVRFAGHPDLRRILMPADWEGHPLRKDYPTEGYR